jgi:hypothetical protein
MLKLYPAHLINGITVYEDDDPHSPAFYVMPDEPDFRRDANGNPLMKFIKYLTPVNRTDGSQGGGFLIFDSQFVLSQDTIKSLQKPCADILASRFIPAPGVDPAVAAQQQLQSLQNQTEANNQALANGGGGNAALTTPPPTAPAGTIGLVDGHRNPIAPQISLPNFSSGTASLVLLDSGGALVSKIESAGKPSLLGSMICSFTAELTPEGAAVVEQAMSGGGGVVQIAYNLSYWGSLPSITGHVWFNSMKFASFYQKIDNTQTGDWWSGYTDTEKETMRNNFVSSQSGGVEFDFTGSQSTDPSAQKLKNDLVDWGWQQLSAATASVLGQSSSGSSNANAQSGSGDGSSSGTSSVSGGVTGANTGSELGQDTSNDGKDHVTRDEQSSSLYSFDETYKERDSILFSTTQQGTLPNPSAAQFAKCKATINADDPFFQQIHATLHVNADFAKFLIDSVDVNCVYSKMTPNTVAGMHFTKPDDLLKFDSNTNNGDKTYSYAYAVNFEDQSAPYAAPAVATNSPVVTIDVGAMGILYVNMTVSNVDFAAVSSVQVAITYPDTDPTGASVKREYSLTSTQRTATMVVIMLKPITKKYSYQFTYVMADGTQVIRPWATDNTQELFINSPFESRTYSFVAEGDFLNDIDNIFLRMTYTDAANNYTQSTDYVFNAAKPNLDWKFPAIAKSYGAMSYSGVVTHKNHTTENIPQTVATGTLVTFGPPNQAVITVTPDTSLIDFTQVKLIKLEFVYADPANNINLASEIVVKQTGSTPASWTFYVRDPTKKAYTYTPTYFVAAPGAAPHQVTGDPVTTTDTDLVLMMPSS